MRVVGGKFRGRNLSAFDCDKIRPTSDKARESFFNIMMGRIGECNFLDLFCGTGAMGIEALSRGAKYVALNDLNADSLKVARKNVEKIGNPDGIEIFNRDAILFLKTSDRKFDIIYIDPPYKSGLAEAALEASINAISNDGIIAVETETPYDGQTFGLIKYDERKYGRARITFFKKESV